MGILEIVLSIACGIVAQGFYTLLVWAIRNCGK